MTNAIEKKPEQSVEVSELEDAMLDVAVGGVFSANKVDVNLHCPVTNNTVAGCGAAKTPGAS